MGKANGRRKVKICSATCMRENTLMTKRTGWVILFGKVATNIKAAIKMMKGTVLEK
jgi:ribosomal protein L14